MKNQIHAIGLVTLAALSISSAEVKLPPIISSHMVLQRDMQVPIWGTVVANSGKVPDPVALRYAWSKNRPWANLFNKDGLPALTLRTDDWDNCIAFFKP